MAARPILDETAEPQTLAGILQWNLDVAESILIYRASILSTITNGGAVPQSFIGLPENEVEAKFTLMLEELNRMTVLNLVACGEALIRIDFLRRVKGKLKDDLSKEYRKWYKTLSKKKQVRPDFDKEGILTCLKQTKTLGRTGKQILDDFRVCLRSRHWFAHGRYWAKPVEIDTLDPDEVFRRTDALLQALAK